MEQIDLSNITDGLKQLRNLKLKIDDLEQQLKESKAEQYQLERTTLVDMFHTAGINNLGLAPEGNMPGYEASLIPHYKANIAESWPQDKKNDAFNWLRENGAASLIKSTIVIRLPMKSQALRKKVLTLLRKIDGLDFSESLAVPWNSLTAWLKEVITKRHEMPPLDVLGADVGHIVKLTEQKNG